MLSEADRFLLEAVRGGEESGWAKLVDRYQGKRLNSPNDVVVRSDGSVYFTEIDARRIRQGVEEIQQLRELVLGQFDLRKLAGVGDRLHPHRIVDHQVVLGIQVTS